MKGTFQCLPVNIKSPSVVFSTFTESTKIHLLGCKMPWKCFLELNFNAITENWWRWISAITITPPSRGENIKSSMIVTYEIKNISHTFPTKTCTHCFIDYCPAAQSNDTFVIHLQYMAIYNLVICFQFALSLICPFALWYTQHFLHTQSSKLPSSFQFAGSKFDLFCYLQLLKTMYNTNDQELYMRISYFSHSMKRIVETQLNASLRLLKWIMFTLFTCIIK